MLKYNIISKIAEIFCNILKKIAFMLQGGAFDWWGAPNFQPVPQ
jgi:hypothetical protein